jgi:hypothetical protein
MDEAMDVELDMVRTAEALQVVLEFLIRYDQAHAVLTGDRNGNAYPLSPLTLRVDDGLHAANRVLSHLRGVEEPVGVGPHRPPSGVTAAPGTRPGAISHPPLPRHGDRVEVGPRRCGHGDPGE